MWTSTLELDLAHVIPTKLLGVFWRGAYFSSFAPLQVQNLPRQPLPAPHWVRVRNSLAGICGSDLHQIFMDGDLNSAPAAVLRASSSHGHAYPTYPGHEVVGEVIEVGDDVQSLQVGDRVVLQHGPNCLTAAVQPLCRSCAAGNYGLCEGGVLPGPQPIGGGWSEEMLLHEQQLFRISPNITDAQAVLLEPSAVAVHAVLRRLPQAGDRVLIIGAGTIGLLILQAIRTLAPAAEVHILARHAFQVERAASMGARIIYPQDSYKQVQLATAARLYEGKQGNKMLLGGYEVIYDTVGSKSTTHDSLRWARAGSTVVIVGLNLRRMPIDLSPIWFQEVNLIGSMGHGRETWPIGTSEKKSTFEITAELIEQQRIKPDELITQRYLLSEYRAALMDVKNKTHNRVIKVVFDFSRQPPSVVPNVRASRHRQRALPTATRTTNDDNYVDVPPSTPELPASEQDIRKEQYIVEVPLTHPVRGTLSEEQITGNTLPSRRGWPNMTSRLSQPQNIDAEDEDDKTRVFSPSKHPRFDITSQYGSLPGFHQGLEELGMTVGHSYDDEMIKTSVPQAQGLLIPQTSLPLPQEEEMTAVGTGYEEERENEYAWTQFMEPQHTSEDIGEILTTAFTEAERDEAETPHIEQQNTGEHSPETPFDISQSTGEEHPWMYYVASSRVGEEDSELQIPSSSINVAMNDEEIQAFPPINSVEDPLPTLANENTHFLEGSYSADKVEDPMPTLTNEDSEATKTVVNPAKRPRSKRKTGTIQKSPPSEG